MSWVKDGQEMNKVLVHKQTLSTLHQPRQLLLKYINTTVCIAQIYKIKLSFHLFMRIVDEECNAAQCVFTVYGKFLLNSQISIGYSV